jgi:hypothetical protein
MIAYQVYNGGTGKTYYFERYAAAKAYYEHEVKEGRLASYLVDIEAEKLGRLIIACLNGRGFAGGFKVIDQKGERAVPGILGSGERGEYESDQPVGLSEYAEEGAWE